MKYVFAGNRDIGIWVLEYLIGQGYSPDGLMVTDEDDEHTKELIHMTNLSPDQIFVGPPNRHNDLTERLKDIAPDYIFGIHYPYIVKSELLDIPKLGFLNLHPAFLPYNRGWHTPSWAILEGTPIGATLHYMSEQLDMGDIIHQKKMVIEIDDTADSLYQKLKKLEFDVFVEAFAVLIGKTGLRIAQIGAGTSHTKKELFEDAISKLDLDESYCFRELLARLRALTTNASSEACYFVENGEKYRITVKVEKELLPKGSF